MFLIHVIFKRVIGRVFNGIVGVLTVFVKTVLNACAMSMFLRFGKCYVLRPYKALARTSRTYFWLSLHKHCDKTMHTLTMFNETDNILLIEIKWHLTHSRNVG